MLLRRKLLAAVVIAAILFLMLASQRIHSRNFLYLSATMSVSGATATRVEHGRNFEEKLVNLQNDPKVLRRIKPTAPTDDMIPEPTPDAPRIFPPPSPTPSQVRVEPVDKRRLCGCTDSCISDLGGSDWFSQRYDPQQEPVLQGSNSNLDLDALQWWLALQRSSTDQTLEEVLTKMFQVISPPTLDFRPLHSRCRSCAVIGNSGKLRNSRHGNLINSHTSIIRMNKAVTRGFEEDVGNRTTHHFLYPESAVDVDGGVSLVLLPFKLRDLEWLTSALSTGQVKMTYMRVKDRVKADKDKVLVVNPVFFNYVHEKWTERHGRYPSTGMLAIIFALHTCDQVSVFGYGADQEGNWHHYWEKNRYAGAFRKTGVHSADFETQVIHQLADEGKITLHL